MKDILLYPFYAIIFGIVIWFAGGVVIAVWAMLRAIGDDGSYTRAVGARWSMAWNWFRRRILEHI